MIFFTNTFLTLNVVESNSPLLEPSAFYMYVISQLRIYIDTIDVELL